MGGGGVGLLSEDSPQQTEARSGTRRAAARSVHRIIDPPESTASAIRRSRWPLGEPEAPGPCFRGMWPAFPPARSSTIRVSVENARGGGNVPPPPISGSRPAKGLPVVVVLVVAGTLIVVIVMIIAVVGVVAGVAIVGSAVIVVPPFALVPPSGVRRGVPVAALDTIPVRAVGAGRDVRRVVVVVAESGVAEVAAVLIIARATVAAVDRDAADRRREMEANRMHADDPPRVHVLRAIVGAPCPIPGNAVPGADHHLIAVDALPAPRPPLPADAAALPVTLTARALPTASVPLPLPGGPPLAVILGLGDTGAHEAPCEKCGRGQPHQRRAHRIRPYHLPLLSRHVANAVAMPVSSGKSNPRAAPFKKWQDAAMKAFTILKRGMSPACHVTGARQRCSEVPLPSHPLHTAVNKTTGGADK